MPLNPEQQAFQDKLNADPHLRPLAIWTDQQMRGGRTLASVQEQIRRVMTLVGPSREAGKILIFAPREVTLDQIANAIIGVAENGYSPWVGGMANVSPEIAVERPSYSNAEFWQKDGKYEFRYDPADGNEGEFSATKTVGLTEIISGLEKMAMHSPDHFNDLVQESDDAETHDVLIQYVLLGEIVYG